MYFKFVFTFFKIHYISLRCCSNSLAKKLQKGKDRKRLSNNNNTTQNKQQRRHSKQKNTAKTKKVHWQRLVKCPGRNVLSPHQKLSWHLSLCLLRVCHRYLICRYLFSFSFLIFASVSWNFINTPTHSQDLLVCSQISSFGYSADFSPAQFFNTSTRSSGSLWW